MSLRAGRQEVDAINVPQVVIGFIGAVVLVVGTVFVVVTFTKSDSADKVRKEQDAREQPKAGTAPEFGMLHQTLFDTVSDARELRSAQEAQLGSYGWVDKEKQVAHIPIAKAKKMVAAQANGGQPK